MPPSQLWLGLKLPGRKNAMPAVCPAVLFRCQLPAFLPSCIPHMGSNDPAHQVGRDGINCSSLECLPGPFLIRMSYPHPLTQGTTSQMTSTGCPALHHVTAQSLGSTSLLSFHILVFISAFPSRASELPGRIWAPASREPEAAGLGGPMSEKVEGEECCFIGFHLAHR